jgi:hypothetical protein
MSVEAVPTSIDDAALIAELTPQMLAKLKADSRQQALSTNLLFVSLGVFVLPNLAKQFDGWAGPLLLLIGVALNIYALAMIARSYIGQPSMLRDELRYRRQHGKWRWER